MGEESTVEVEPTKTAERGDNVANQNENAAEDKDAAVSGTEARRHALDDARQRLAELHNSIGELGQKGWRVMQFNATVVTILATFGPSQLSISSNSSFVLGAVALTFGLALVSFAYSTWVGYRMQSPDELENGPGSDVYSWTSEYDYSEDEYLSTVLEDYAESINTVEDCNAKVASKLGRTLAASAVGMAFLLLGIVVTIVL